MFLGAQEYGAARSYVVPRDTAFASWLGAANAMDYGGTLVWEVWALTQMDDSDIDFAYGQAGTSSTVTQNQYMFGLVRHVGAGVMHGTCCIIPMCQMLIQGAIVMLSKHRQLLTGCCGLLPAAPDQAVSSRDDGTPKRFSHWAHPGAKPRPSSLNTRPSRRNARSSGLHTRTCGLHLQRCATAGRVDMPAAGAPPHHCPRTFTICQLNPARQHSGASRPK